MVNAKKGITRVYKIHRVAVKRYQRHLQPMIYPQRELT